MSKWCFYCRQVTGDKLYYNQEGLAGVCLGPLHVGDVAGLDKS